MKLVVICSGGMDSVTLLHKANKEHEVLGVLSFDYGQRHKKELIAAAENAALLGLEHHIVDLQNIKPFLKGSALTDEIDVPEGHYEENNMKLTVVPNRNMIMLSIATAYAISKGAERVAYGAHSGDHTIYPDCRPEFIFAMNEVMKVCDFKPIHLYVPFMEMNKVSILKEGLELGVDYSKTWTCYKGGDKACGVCGSCQERLEAFKENNIEDPLEYEHRNIIKKQ